MATAVETKKETKFTKAPDFYWQFRLDRLIKKKGGEYAFDAKNYRAQGPMALYRAYYLDLTLNGKIDKSFDKAAENTLNDDEWVVFYETIAAWTKEQADKSLFDASTLPASDFDLIAQIYPEVNMKAIYAPLDESDYGKNFPYKNIKEMLDAASNDKFKVDKAVFNDMSEAMVEFNKLKEKSFQSLESVYADATAFAKNPFPDDQSRAHYKAIREKLAALPQTPQQWETYNSNMLQQIDEMARLASKEVEPHHHGHDDEHHHEELSPAQEFQKKYGRDLTTMAERASKYMSDPAGFVKSAVSAKFGAAGVEAWEKNEELAAKFSVMSASDKAKMQSQYSDFLKQA